MNKYKNELDGLSRSKIVLAEKMLLDESIDTYERFSMLDDIYPVSQWIVYPFAKLLIKTLTDKVPAVNLPHIRPSYMYMDYADRHQIIHFSSLVEGFGEDVLIAFNADDFEDLTQEQLNSPVIKLFHFDKQDYFFSYNELINCLIEYAIATKTSGITYDW